MERTVGGGHRRARDLAATAIDFRLEGDEARVLDEHLSRCGPCRAVAADLRADAIALAELVRTGRAAGRPMIGPRGGYNPAR